MIQLTTTAQLLLQSNNNKFEAIKGSQNLIINEAIIPNLGKGHLRTMTFIEIQELTKSQRAFVIRVIKDIKPTKVNE